MKHSQQYLLPKNDVYFINIIRHVLLISAKATKKVVFLYCNMGNRTMNNSTNLSYKERFSLLLYRYAEGGNCCLALLCRVFSFFGRKCCLVLDNKDCKLLLSPQDSSSKITGKRRNNIKPITKDNFDDMCFNLANTEEEKNSIENDALFQYINKIKNGKKDNFDLYAYYYNDLELVHSKNIDAWLNTILNEKDGLLMKCRADEKEKALVEYYKMIFNMTRIVTADFSARYVLDEDFRLKNDITFIGFQNVKDAPYDDDIPVTINENRARELYKELSNINRKYGRLPKGALADVPKTLDEVRDSCCENFEPLPQDYFENIEGGIKKNIYSQFNNNGKMAEIPRLRIDLQAPVLSKELVSRIEKEFNH